MADQWECPERVAVAFEPVSAILDTGTCEPLKAAVHGALLAMAALCAAYNSAAWLKRRERHLAINAVLYSTVVFWERCHVVHHLAACRITEPFAAPPQQKLSEAA